MSTITGYRGEQSGILFTHFDLAKTSAKVGFFFTTKIEHAYRYAGTGTPVRAFKLETGRCLNLQNPHRDEIQPFLRDLWDEYADWVDRYSGEALNRYDLGSLLETGMLYDYEGTGSGQRWSQLFRLARNQGFDSVMILDATDGSGGQPVLIVIVFDACNVSLN